MCDPAADGVYVQPELVAPETGLPSKYHWYTYGEVPPVIDDVKVSD